MTNSNEYPTPYADDEILTLKDLVGKGKHEKLLAQSTIYREVDAGRFPAPIRISARRHIWTGKIINDWLHKRIAARDVA